MTVLGLLSLWKKLAIVMLYVFTFFPVCSSHTFQVAALEENVKDYLHSGHQLEHYRKQLVKIATDIRVAQYEDIEADHTDFASIFEQNVRSVPKFNLSKSEAYKKFKYVLIVNV